MAAMYLWAMSALPMNLSRELILRDPITAEEREERKDEIVLYEVEQL